MREVEDLAIKILVARGYTVYKRGSERG